VNKKKRVGFWCAAVAPVVIVWSGIALAHPYIVIDLGPTPAGFQPVTATGTSLNSRGQVAGIFSGDHTVAAIGIAGGGVRTVVARDLTSELGGINESGNAVGFLLPNDSSDPRSFFYAGGKLVYMGTLGGAWAMATAISNTNLATGDSADASGVQTAFLWNGSSMIAVPTPPGAISSGNGVSDNGDVTGVVGFGSDPGSDYQAFVWKGREMILLEGGLFSQGNAVNSEGVVVGESDFGAGIGFQATMWTASGTRVNLAPAGSAGSEALAINNAGVIVGSATIESASFATHAYVWKQGTGTDLGGLLPGGVESMASNINDAGAVLGLTLPNTSGNEVIEWAPSVPVALDALLNQVRGIGPGESLTIKVWEALASYALKDTRATCGALTGFANEVKALGGKKIDHALARRLLSNAGAIEAATGCR
jgi:probable HAF family extracellular repeat protein